MKTTTRLDQQIRKAALTSMRIEGYRSTQSVEIKARAKALMKERNVRVLPPTA